MSRVSVRKADPGCSSTEARPSNSDSKPSQTFESPLEGTQHAGVDKKPIGIALQRRMDGFERNGCKQYRVSIQDDVFRGAPAHGCRIRLSDRYAYDRCSWSRHGCCSVCVCFRRSCQEQPWGMERG